MSRFDAVKLFCVEFASQKSLTGATKVAIGNKIFLITLKIAQSSGVASVSSPSLSVALHDVPLGTFSDDIKSALGIFGVVTSVKLKPAGLWQYAVVNFKDTFSATAALTYWSVLIKKDSVRILLLVNQNEVITLKDAFKAKLVNFPFGCTVFKISDLVSQVGGHTCLNHLALECKVLSPLPSKVSSNFSGGPKVFKFSFARSKSYVKAKNSFCQKIPLIKVHFIIIITDFKVSDNNNYSKVTTVTNRSTSKDTTKNIDQMEGNPIVNTEKEGNSTFIPNQIPVEKTRPITPPFRFEYNNVIIGSVNTSKLQIHQREQPHTDFSPLTGNRLEEKHNKKYRHLEKISVKNLTERFNQVIEEELTNKTTDQTNNFGGNSNKFQIEAWTGKKGASKSLKKLDRPFQLLNKDVERAVQIETALRKYNPEILDMINKEKSVKKTDEQMDNPFEINKDIADLEETAEDMEDSELGLSNRMPSPSPGQKSNRLSERNATSTEANQEEGWKTVIHSTKRHVLFVQIVDIPEKNMGKKVGWIYNLLGDVKIKIDFSQIAGRDQAKKILAETDIESFLMATDDIANQMAGQKKVLVRNIPLGISDREVGAAMKKFGEQLAMVEFSNQEEATRAVDQLSTLIRKDTIRIYPMIVPTDAKECYFCYQIGHLVSNSKLYVRKNIPEEPIKAFGGRLYAEMAALNPSNNRNNTNPSGSQKAGLQKSKIDELRQQVNEMAKLLNAVASKLGVTVEKKKEDKVVINPPSHISEERKEGSNRKVKQDMSSKHNSEEKKEAYNSEKKINEIKKALEPIIILLKQVEKQGNWNDAMAGESKSMETDDNIADNNTWKIGTINVRGLNNLSKAEEFDFVVITETKLTPLKEKGVFFGTKGYHVFWESSTEKQMRTKMGILVKKCWTHHVKIIRGYQGRLLHLVLKFKGKISVYIVGLYMPASKLPTEKAVAKEIRKLLADIVQNKEIVIVVDNLNKDLAAKLLEETIVTNKEKKSNGVQRRLDYVFTDVITVLLVTNIEVINVNESFSTDYKAVVTIIRSNRILTGTKKSKSGRKKYNSNNDLNQMWLTIKEIVLQAAECLPKRKVGAQSAHTKKECMDYKLVKIAVNAYLMNFPKDKLIVKLLSTKKEYRSILHASVMGWSNKLMDSKGEQNCRIMKIIKGKFNFKEQIE
ncbi:hypothetical protein G9A89_011169 [Geosiphon pyriformis]|nr:hypothetical protein G9A89_011169 [Geosiphon pyriformis]